MKPIVVVGSINMDLVVRAPHIPSPGETLIGSSFEMHSGGKGANQAVAVARLEYPCFLLGKVGSDVFGQTLLRSLEEFGVDVSRIERTDGPSGTAVIAVDDAGENCIIVSPGANSHVDIDYLQRNRNILNDAGMVLAQLEVPLATIEWLARTCNDAGVPFMLDPAPARELPASLLSCVDWLTPNETEAWYLAPDVRTETEILAALFARGARGVVLKRGAKGAVLGTQNGGQQHVSPYAVEARDTTAAGDAFNGAFATALLRGLSPARSADFANAAAAISVTREGAQPSVASLREVQDFLRRLGSD